MTLRIPQPPRLKKVGPKRRIICTVPAGTLIKDRRDREYIVTPSGALQRTTPKLKETHGPK